MNKIDMNKYITEAMKLDEDAYKYKDLDDYFQNNPRAKEERGERLTRICPLCHGRVKKSKEKTSEAEYYCPSCGEYIEASKVRIKESIMEEFNDEEIEIPVAKISWWEGRPETLIIIKFIDDDEIWYEYDGSRTGLGGGFDEFHSMDDAIKGFIDGYASEIKDLKFRRGYEKYQRLFNSTGSVEYEA